MMNAQKAMLWVRQKIRKDTFLWFIVRYCYRVGYKIYRIPELIIRKCGKNWYVKNIELHITYRCNKLCKKCSHFCNFTKLPYLKNSDMTIEQIEKFINQVKQKNIHLDHIRILGGEPLLHPRLNDFISIIFYKLMIPGNVFRMEIRTNGIIDSNDVLKDCRRDPNINKAFNEKRIAIVISHKEADKLFRYVLSAPVDLDLPWDMCRIPYDCGIILNTYGYWPGPACGLTGLLFGLTGYARYEFPIKFRETWPELKKDLCKYCTAGCKELMNKKEGNITSSYKEAFSRWMKGEFSVPSKF